MGKIVLYEEVDGPKWQEYNLSDGNVLRIKTELVKVLDTGHVNELGEPIYHLQTKTISTVYLKEQGFVRKEK
jgi:methyl coenzyme M reductase gamma subunit